MKINSISQVTPALLEKIGKTGLDVKAIPQIEQNAIMAQLNQALEQERNATDVQFDDVSGKFDLKDDKNFDKQDKFAQKPNPFNTDKNVEQKDDKLEISAGANLLAAKPQDSQSQPKNTSLTDEEENPFKKKQQVS